MDDRALTMTSSAGHSTRLVWADWTGLAASIGCAVHCAAMPLVIAYLPALGLGWLAGEGFHKWMAVLCFLLAAVAFLPGWRKHRSLVPSVLGGVGLLLLCVAAYGLEGSCCPTGAPPQEGAVAASACGEAECSHCQLAVQAPPPVPKSASLAAALVPLITPLGGLLLVIAHVTNHRKNCKCRGDSCCLPGAKPSPRATALIDAHKAECGTAEGTAGAPVSRKQNVEML